MEREIVGEKAAALGRAGERLEEALTAARRLAAAVEAAADPRERARLAGEHAEARRRVRHARLALLIQREAVGLRHHAVVDQQFPENAADPHLSQPTPGSHYAADPHLSQPTHEIPRPHGSDQ